MLGHCPKQLVTDRQVVANILDLLITMVRRGGNHCGTKDYPFNATHLEDPSFLRFKSVDLYFEDTFQAEGYIEVELIEGGTQSEFTVFDHQQPFLQAVLQCSNHEERIAFRTAIKKVGQSGPELLLRSHLTQELTDVRHGQS